jgi:phosphomannomutase
VTVFRAYDVRGVYGTHLTEDLAKRVGAAFGSYLEGGAITLGRDPRKSGPSLEAAFMEGVLGTGCEVYRYGILPVPILSYVTMRDKRKAAAYISASHNPPEYNGIRFRTSDGYGMLYGETGMMEIYHSGKFRSGHGMVHSQDPGDAVEDYRDFVSSKLDIKPGLKIVLDMGNGSASIMDPLYKDLGLQTMVLNGFPDGMFPGRGTTPNEDTLIDASKTLVTNGADYGVGFDPDADRGIVIDDLGRVVPPEKVAIILAEERFSPGDTVIAGFDCSMILEKELQPRGFKVLRERVGDVYVANRVKNSGAVLGVERSGHFFMPEFQYSDDPFAMSLALGEILSQGERLSQLADAIPDYPYIQKKIKLDTDPAHVMASLGIKLAHLHPDTTDGLKIVTETSSVLIRPSNTEPLIRLYVETMEHNLDDLVQKYERLVRETMG